MLPTFEADNDSPRMFFNTVRHFVQGSAFIVLLTYSKRSPCLSVSLCFTGTAVTPYWYFPHAFLPKSTADWGKLGMTGQQETQVAKGDQEHQLLTRGF